ncbi:MAG: YaiO family outer membrane beta-barrel protein [Bacteroidales bacterium]|nr:YaiO family outer membrane beta-barrel protein [Bacteroidales bacterium]
MMNFIHRLFFIFSLVLLLLPISAEAQTDTLKPTILDEIKVLMQLPNTDSALKLCESTLSEDSELHDVRLMMAVIYLRMDSLDDAHNELSYITSRNSDYKEAWFLLGNIALWKSDYQMAISNYFKAFSSEYNEVLTFNKAIAHFKLKDYNSAEPLIDTVLAKNRNHSEALILKDEIILAKANVKFANGQFAEALKDFKYYVNKYPLVNDARFNLSRTYYSLNYVDSSLNHLDTILQKDSMNYDALMYITNIYMGKRDWDNALKYHQRLLKLHPDDPAFLLRLAQILKEKAMYQEAYNVADTLYTRNNADSNALELLYELSPYVFRNTFTASYNVDAFKDFGPWHFIYIQLSRSYDKNIFVGRVNRAEKRGLVGLQLEGDYYRKMKNKSYFYANLGLSRDSLFPSLRIGAEYFHYFNPTVEGSLGFRYLEFDTLNLTIFTASIGKYINKLYAGYRLYTTQIDKTYYSTNVFSVRVFGKHDNFVGIQYLYGLLHDENAWFSNDVYKLKSNTIRLEFFRRISPVLSFQINGAFATEEYKQNLKRQKYSVEFIINRLF